MSSFEASQDRDANRVVVAANEAFRTVAPWTFVAGTTGAVGAHTVFTVTGDIIVTVFAICNTSLAGATATVALGTANNTTGLLGAATTATTIVANDVWTGSGASATEIGDLTFPYVIANGADIVLTVATAAVSAGVLDIYLLWRPLSTDAAVTVTTPA